MTLQFTLFALVSHIPRLSLSAIVKVETVPEGIDWCVQSLGYCDDVYMCVKRYFVDCEIHCLSTFSLLNAVILTTNNCYSKK